MRHGFACDQLPIKRDRIGSLAFKLMVKPSALLPQSATDRVISTGNVIYYFILRKVNINVNKHSYSNKENLP